ncbi:MAG: hypothetical protein QM831_41380 [Kofleriaceae bacterium]
MSSDVEFWLNELKSSVARDRVEALKRIAEAPVADVQLLAATERLLGDREVCLVQIPYRFGEVRFFAADAVAAVRQLLGNSDPVVVEGTFYPLTGDDVSKYADAAGVARELGMDGILATLRELVARNAIKTRTITRP